MTWGEAMKRVTSGERLRLAQDLLIYGTATVEVFYDRQAQVEKVVRTHPKSTIKEIRK